MKLHTSPNRESGDTQQLPFQNSIPNYIDKVADFCYVPDIKSQFFLPSTSHMSGHDRLSFHYNTKVVISKNRFWKLDHLTLTTYQRSFLKNALISGRESSLHKRSINLCIWPIIVFYGSNAIFQFSQSSQSNLTKSISRSSCQSNLFTQINGISPLTKKKTLRLEMSTKSAYKLTAH